MQSSWKQNLTLTAVLKRLISHYFQLKTDHAAIEIHLIYVKKQNEEVCIHCEMFSETVYHALLKCRKWQTQYNALYKDLIRAEVSQISAAEKHSESRLLENFRVTKVLLNFLAVITVECFENEDIKIAVRAQQNDEHDLEKLKRKKWTEKE